MKPLGYFMFMSFYAMIVTTIYFIEIAFYDYPTRPSGDWLFISIFLLSLVYIGSVTYNFLFPLFKNYISKFRIKYFLNKIKVCGGWFIQKFRKSTSSNVNDSQKGIPF